MITDTEEINVVIEDNETISVTEGTPTDIAEIMHNEEIRQENEAQRIANEEQRIENEQAREDYITDLKQRVLDGEFNGQDGQDGQDGFSPIANVSKSGDTATITITDKNGTTTASISDGTDGQDGNDGISPTVSMEKQGKVTTLTITDAIGTHTTEIRDGNDGSGTGDMLKSTYDTNDNGVVDNAEKVNNHTVGCDVPADAVFTDTTYTAGTGIDITNNVISSTQSSAEWGNISGILSDQTDLMTVLDLKLDNTIQNSLIGSSESSPVIFDGLTPGIYPLYSTTDEIHIKLKSTIPDDRYIETNYNGGYAYLIVNKTIDYDSLEYEDVIAYVICNVQNNDGTSFLAIRTLIFDNSFNGHFRTINKNIYLGKVLNDSTQTIDGVKTFSSVPVCSTAPTSDTQLANKKYVDDSIPDVSNFISTSSTAGLVKNDGTIDTTSYSTFSGSYNDLTDKPTIPDELADLSDDSTHRVVTDTEKTTWSGKQDALVSGTNIKTINSTSILGSGNIEVGADIPQQDTAPSNPSEDDLWIDTDDNTNLVNIDSIISTTSTNPIENQAITNFILDNITPVLNNLITYSTTETQIGYWTDGKPIYRQVITGTTANSNSPTAIGSITNLGEIVKIDGFIRTSNQSIPTNFVYNTEQNSCYREGNNIIVRATASSYQNKSCYIIVEYTKTTD